MAITVAHNGKLALERLYLRLSITDNILCFYVVLKMIADVLAIESLMFNNKLDITQLVTHDVFIGICA